MQNPYAAWEQYHAAGWTGILPLPFRKKHPVPDGTTGRDGRDPSYADMMTWSEDGARNIALRMPRYIIGIDVDHYGDKRGGDTIDAIEAEIGALPRTWKSGSREGRSGIYYYRIPENYIAVGKLVDVEMIQHHHRYAVVWPSENPNDSLNTYKWFDPSGDEAQTIPAPSEFPMLPVEWMARLERGGELATKADIAPTQALAILAGFPKGDPCDHILKATAKVFGLGAKHDLYNEAVMALCGAGRKGCPGAQDAIGSLRENFQSVMTTGPKPRTVTEAMNEWNRSLLGAIAIVAKEEQGDRCIDQVIDDYMDYLGKELAPAIETGAAEEAQAPEPAKPSIEDDPMFISQAKMRAFDMLVNDAAKTMFNTHKLGEIPVMTGIDLDDFLAQPDEDENYRVAGLWPAEGRVLLAAAAKAGKTTMVAANLIPAIVDGRKFLNQYPTTKLNGRLAYFNMEVGENTLRRWMRDSGVQGVSQVVVVNLRGKASHMALSTPDGRKRLGTWLAARDVEIAIIDPLAPILAAHGLDENSNTDVATFFSWWTEALTIAGVKDDLIVHHTGHAGQRSRGASRLLDEPDAIWTLAKTDDEDPTDSNPYGNVGVRTFSAYGRDVDLEAQVVTYDPTTRQLSLSGNPKLVALNHLTAAINHELRNGDRKSEKDVIDAVKSSITAGLDTKRVIQDLADQGKIQIHQIGNRRELSLVVGQTLTADDL